MSWVRVGLFVVMTENRVGGPGFREHTPAWTTDRSRRNKRRIR
jgi:hypothetical protein